jgi:acyl-coenzyme A synthetase/AMP-(fatty) acid ligase
MDVVHAMVVAISPTAATDLSLPLLGSEQAHRLLAFDGARRVDAAQFLADVRAAAATLPAGTHAVNLCEDRYQFLVAFCAVALRGQTNLLPSSRAPEVVVETLARYPDAYCLGDAQLCAMCDEPPHCHHLASGHARVDGAFVLPQLPAAQAVALGFTSGSTGQPKANCKSWRGFSASTRHNIALLRSYLPADAGTASIVATVPPQHMYGMELSVLLPLLGDFAVHTARPFFPSEIVQALHDAPAPRLLVTTPVHLRALLGSDLELPALAAIVSATAPLTVELAKAAEARWGVCVLEIFGSTETCVIAHRRTAIGAEWSLYPGISLQPQPDGTQVDAPYFDEPVLLQDIVELLPQSRFLLRGRNADLLEIAGKRASLGDLTRRLLAIPGVQDGIVFQADENASGGVRRIAALAVAPQLSEAQLLAALRRVIDPVFLPRPLRCVAALPRNETGKLPRAELLALLSGR